MGMTIAEKIIALAAGVPEVKAGDIHTVNLDRMMSNDGTTHLTVDMYRSKLKNPRIADPKKMVFIVDHNVPSDSPKTAAAQKKMRDFAKENGIDLKEGVYVQLTGPCYESPAEIKMLSNFADAVGMSTVVEAIAANHAGMKICGISCICNLAAGMNPTPLSHKEVQEAADMAAEKFTRLVTDAIMKF